MAKLMTRQGVTWLHASTIQKRGGAYSFAKTVRSKDQEYMGPHAPIIQSINSPFGHLNSTGWPLGNPLGPTTALVDNTEFHLITPTLSYICTPSFHGPGEPPPFMVFSVPYYLDMSQCNGIIISLLSIDLTFSKKCHIDCLDIIKHDDFTWCKLIF